MKKLLAIAGIAAAISLTGCAAKQVPAPVQTVTVVASPAATTEVPKTWTSSKGITFTESDQIPFTGDKPSMIVTMEGSASCTEAQMLYKIAGDAEETARSTYGQDSEQFNFTNAVVMVGLSKVRVLC